MSQNDEQAERAQRALEALGKLLNEVNKRQNGMETIEGIYRDIGVVRTMFGLRADELYKRPEINRNMAEAIDLVDDVSRYAAAEAFPPRTKIHTYAQAAAYFRALMHGRRVEYCYLLCLDRFARLISCPLLERGTVDRSVVYIREAARTAMRAGAKYTVLAHNHPGGTLEPSPADIQVTTEAIEAMHVIGAPLLDHIIVADNGAVSVRALGHPAERMWLGSRTNDKYMNGWLAADVPARGK